MFCTVQAAANVVNKGQTVDIMAAGTAYDPQSVTITRSGTATEPITFTWLGTGPDPAIISPPNQTGKAVVTLDGVHDVTLSHLQIDGYATDDGIDVIDSSDISLANLVIGHTIAVEPVSTGISIDGTSSDVTVSKTVFDGTYLDAVLASAGAQRVTVTTNVVERNYGSGFVLDGSLVMP